MNIVTYNIIGGGNTLKRIRIREFFPKGKVELCLIQETKL